jgi:hypothetical protein
MKMSFSEICQWAKKAARATKDAGDSPESEAEFTHLAQESGLGTRWLAYYTNAYEAAGESGIKALSYRKKMPDEILNEGLKKINDYLDEMRRLLKEKAVKAQIDFEPRYKGNQITVYEKRPLFNDPSETSHLAVFQVRYTDYDKRWHLYWMRKFNRWWPYVPDKPVITIEDCIREVENDKWGCFWG